jgi:hypothetical protein
MRSNLFGGFQIAPYSDVINSMTMTPHQLALRPHRINYLQVRDLGLVVPGESHVLRLLGRMDAFRAPGDLVEADRIGRGEQVSVSCLNRMR